METVITIRPAKLLLQWTIDPTASYDFSREELKEMCGIIPDFFAEAVLQEKAGTIEEAAQVMGDCYQMGGFNQYPFSGTLDIDGIYHGDGDDPLPPLLKLRALDDPDDNVTCYVYPHGIVAVATLHDSKIARFD